MQVAALGEHVQEWPVQQERCAGGMGSKNTCVLLCKSEDLELAGEVPPLFKRSERLSAS